MRINKLKCLIWLWTLTTAYKDGLQPSKRGNSTWVTNWHALQYYIEWSLYAFVEGLPPPMLLANSQWIISTVHGYWNYASWTCWTNDKLVNFRNFGQVTGPLNLVQNRNHYRVWRLNCFLMPLIFNLTVSFAVLFFDSILFPFSSSWVFKYRLNKLKTCWTKTGLASSTLNVGGCMPWEDSLCAVLLNLSEPTLVGEGWARRESSPRVKPLDFSELDIIGMRCW